jgi:CheY-like chemotaxis protein
MTIRIVVVDDDDISRRGLTHILSDSEHIFVAGTYTHTEALQCNDGWSDIDVVLVDAADERNHGDQFPGVSVAEHVRRSRSPEQTIIIVLTGHYFHPALRRRMREARADFFYHRSELKSVDALYRAVLHPDEARTVPPFGDLDALLRIGVTDATQVNSALRYAERVSLSETLSRSRSRSRAWFQQRKKFNEIARLSPVNRDGLPPDREQREPSLTQIERFLRWATRIGESDAP